MAVCCGGRLLPTTDWEAAFAAVGAVAEQSRLGARLSETLESSNLVTAPEGFPSVEAARVVFPRT